MPIVRETGLWRARWRVEKRVGDWTWADIVSGRAPAAFAVVAIEHNLLTYGGASALFELLIGSGAITAFNATNAYLGVGDSNSTALVNQTDLQGGNKARVGMDAGWPKHTDGTASASNAQCEWQSTFGAAVGNFAWQEGALFNASSGGRMVNRKVLTGLGTKSNGQTWTLKLVATLA